MLGYEKKRWKKKKAVEFFYCIALRPTTSCFPRLQGRVFHYAVCGLSKRTMKSIPTMEYLAQKLEYVFASDMILLCRKWPEKYWWVKGKEWSSRAVVVGCVVALRGAPSTIF